MTGADETKGIILQNLDCRISQIEKSGCSRGEIREEKIHNMLENLNYLRKTMAEVNSKLFYGLLLLAIVAFLAGVNVMSEILKVVK